jgi:hypothetical protein
VRDEHGSDTQAALKARDLDAHLVAQLLIEVRQRFVQQQHGGIDDERAGECDALALTAESCSGRRSPSPTSRTRSSAARHAFRDLWLRTLRMRRPKATLSAALKCGKSA